MAGSVDEGKQDEEHYKSLLGKDEKSLSQENTEENGGKTRDGTGADLQEYPSLLSLALQELLKPYSSDLLQLEDDYRGLVSTLTPRQLKSFLRVRLYGSQGDEGSDLAPTSSLLREIFPFFWDLRRHERDCYRSLHYAAKAVVDTASREEFGVTHEQSARFFRQAAALTREAEGLGDARLQEEWPQDEHEQALLIRLLAAVSPSGQGGQGPAGYGAPAGHAQQGTAGSGTPPGSIGVSPQISSNLAQGDPEFSRWVEELFGRRPKGSSLLEHVTDFQEQALQRYRSGDRSSSWQAVAGYADGFLERHAPWFSQAMVPILSNLAVLINDITGLEAEAERLFQQAENIAPPDETRILFYHADFITDALEQKNRANNLEKYYGEEAGQIAQDFKDKLSNLDDLRLTRTQRLHLDLLKRRLQRIRSESENQGGAGPVGMRDAWPLARDNAPLFLEAARAHDGEPAARLSGGLDGLLGERNAAMLPVKGALLGALWRVLEACGAVAGTWTVRLRLADHYVGESNIGSREEALGLRLNAALAADEGLLGHGPSVGLPALWTQSSAILARRRDQDLGQVALGFLTARQVYGGEPQWEQRLQRAWSRAGGEGDPPGIQDLEQALNAQQRQALEALQEEPANPGRAKAVVQEVFGDDLEPIGEAKAFANEAELDQVFGEEDTPEDFSSAIEELKRVACPEGPGADKGGG